MNDHGIDTQALAEAGDQPDPMFEPRDVHHDRCRIWTTDLPCNCHHLPGCVAGRCEPGCEREQVRGC